MGAALEILLISFGTVLVQNYFFKKLSDQVVLRDLKKQVDELNGKLKLAQKEKDLEKMNQVMNKMNDVSMKRMKLTMQPNMISSFMFIFVLGWMRGKYEPILKATPVRLPISIPVPAWQFPPVVFTSTLGWFGWYLLCAITSSILVKELLDVEY